MPADAAAPAASDRTTRPTLGHYWLAEAIRLREEHWGPLEDASAVRVARKAPTLSDRILTRAALLGRREGLDTLLARWRQSASLAFLVLTLLVLGAGAATAAGALGDGSRPVNVLWALGALLGLHGIMFLLWLVGMLLPLPKGATGLGRIWMWATRRVARGPDAALIPQALLNLLGRAGVLRWLFGAVSHLLWLAAMLAALATLLTILSTQSYRFVWATTLLDPQAFVQLTALLGWFPAALGFALPDPAFVAASDGTTALPAIAQTQWSIWLIGMVVCYGVLPRLLAAALCLGMCLRRAALLRIDPDLPGYAALRDRLEPPAQHTGIDRPADPLHSPRVTVRQSLPDLGQRPVLAALELPDDIAWPPALASANDAAHYDAGMLDDREQRNALLDALATTPAPRLLLACDVRQTPDRGTLALIAALSAHAGQTRVLLVSPATDEARELLQTRRRQWQERLDAAGLPEQALHQHTEAAIRWLETGHD
ncbi:DUF2868 domain-containing protein [Bordetella genomosp. 5]|uniref:DUF2868 domain-containing protein n=1 Tax=Bordetella genomosp. 5 TaxID=1395608 RepID=A0A261U0I0_9BORD|nr:hypothetical protein CAL25_01585 [Bordetella genomosp. 5]